MGDVVVRRINGDDWRLWRDVRLRGLRDSPSAFGSTYEREIGFGEDEFRARVAVNGPAVLAVRGDRPVGMGAGLTDVPGWLQIVSMWVDPVCRGHRIGRRILDELVAWARERHLRVHLDVTIGNSTARGLYERSGFVATGETRELRPGAAERVERMVLPDERPIADR